MDSRSYLARQPSLNGQLSVQISCLEVMRQRVVQEEWNNFLLSLLVQVLVPAYLRCIPHIHIPKQKVKVTGHEYDKKYITCIYENVEKESIILYK